ncbi:RHS repeat domain-containing protein [Psychrobacillus sp. L4]|uniref:RHS repeat domain-containing protein n=1 Tax=Psychrobacillus sp. L4 TaxID=3236892 RepID=UPI0036F2849C
MIKAHAFFNIQYLDSQNNIISWVDNRYSKLAGKKDWTHRQVTFKTPNNAAKIRVYLEVEHKDDTAEGQAWFDAIQLEKAEVSSSFNPILNSSFEGKDTNWTGTGGKFDTISDNVFDGSQSLQVIRNTTSQGSSIYTQRINIGQTTSKQPIPITLTGLSKASNVIANGDEVNKEDYSISATVNYTNKNKKVFYSDFPIGTQEWNRSAISIPASEPIDSIDVSIIFKGSYTGTVWFDAIRLIQGSVVTKNSYDSNGYQNGTEDEMGYKTSSEIDDVGNKKEETDAKGTIKSYKYYATDLLEYLQLTNGTSIHYEYDKNGNMKSKSIIDKVDKSQVFKYKYDALNRLINTKGPFNDVTTNECDSIGNKTKTVLPTGKTIQWTYDGMDRLKGLTYNNELYYTFDYDNNGNEKSVTYVKEGRKKERDYDTSNRVTALKDRGGLQQWTYPEDSDKLKGYTFTHGAFTQTNNYTYNQLDQNTIMTAGGYTYRFDYNEKGNVQTFSTGNGVGSTFNYNERGLVSTLTVGTASGEDILTEKYSYDANGNRTKIEYQGDKNTFVSYEYDKLDQLEKEILLDKKMKEYSYDGFGNRVKVTVTENGQTTSQTADYNIANQLTQFGDEIISYDANGNREKDGKYIYKWNDANQLVSVTKSGETTPFATYLYDESGKRIQKNVNGTITNYHYDGDSIDVLYETDEKNNVIRSYTYSASGQILSMKKGTQTFFYHYNVHGDVIALTDQSGQKVATYVYDAWGNVLKAEESDLVKDNPYRYAGYRYDHETGLYYLIARYYQPEQGVFLSLDPYPGDSENLLSQNGYNYANNNPVMNVDPDGEFASDLGARLKYGAGQALKKLLESWGIPLNLGEKIAGSALSFIGGGLYFSKLANKKINSYTAYRTEVGIFSKNFSNTLINFAKKNLVKALGKRAVGMMIGGLGGVLIQEIATFAYWTLVYATIKYNPKK